MSATVTALADRRPKPAPAPAAPRALPHDAAVEAAVLDALINAPIAMAERKDLAATLTPEHFHVEANRVAFPVVAGMVAEDIPTDAAAVASRLREAPPPEVPEGWLGYLRDVVCDQGGATTAARKHHVAILDNLRRCRDVMRQCDSIAARAAAAPPASGLIETACGELSAIGSTKTGTTRSIADIAHDVFTRISTPELRPYSGFPSLDRAIGRLYGGQVTVIAARPKAGKTNLAWHIAENIATAAPAADDMPPEAVFFVTAEMSADALYGRQLGIRARVHPDDIQNGRIQDHQWQRLIDTNKGWANLPILVDDFGSARPSAARIEATVLRYRDRLAAGAYRNKFGYTYVRAALRVIIIDHLGKIASPRDNDSRAGDPQRLKAAMESVVDLAKRTDSHVILLWHAGMRDADPTADLTARDIRGTSDAEGSCDRIVFLTRPEQGRLKLVHYVDRHRGTAADPIWLETEDGAIWEAQQ